MKSFIEWTNDLSLEVNAILQKNPQPMSSGPRPATNQDRLNNFKKMVWDYRYGPDHNITQGFFKQHGTDPYMKEAMTHIMSEFLRYAQDVFAQLKEALDKYGPKGEKTKAIYKKYMVNNFLRKGMNKLVNLPYAKTTLYTNPE